MEAVFFFLKAVLPLQRSQGTSSKMTPLYISHILKKEVNDPALILVQTSQQQHVVSHC